MDGQPLRRRYWEIVSVSVSVSVRGLLAPGRGRGSSVSSVVCYLTGLSHIDPISSRLLLGASSTRVCEDSRTSTSTSHAISASS